MTWLHAYDPTDGLRRATKQRSPNSGLWLFDDPLFQRWIQGPNHAGDPRILWVCGPPGAGKTVLSATAVEYIQNWGTSRGLENSKVAYFYGSCTEKSRGSAFAMCVSILAQLLPNMQDVPGVIQEAHGIAQCHGRSRISEADRVFILFQNVLIALPCVFLIIDALDECSDIAEISSWLEGAVQSIASLHILYFSRDTAAVRKELGCQPSLRMDAASTKDDIDRYLASAILKLPCTDAKMQDLVFDVLSQKAAGMFLFADLSIKTLQSAIDQADMLRILNTIPSGIHAMYDLILEEISKESSIRRALARNVFRLICTAVRPMTWPEMRFALSWDEELQAFCKSKEPFRDTISELCSPLVEYRTETDRFLAAHASVHEYLSTKSPPSNNDIVEFFVEANEASTQLATMMLACIADEKVHCSLDVDVARYPLVPYATKYWCHHLAEAPINGTLQNRYYDFEECPERRSTWIMRRLISEEWSFPLQEVVKVQEMMQHWTSTNGQGHSSLKYRALGDIQRALFCLDEIASQPQSANTISQIRTISNFERLVCVRDLAREYTMAGHIDQGIMMFEDALQKIEESEAGLTSGSCWLLNSLGILYDQQGRTHLAQKVQNNALRIQMRTLPPNHLDIVLTINELGRLARHLEQNKESESLHRRALHLLEEQFPESDLHVTWTKSALGRSLLKLRRADEAIVLHHQVLAVETSRLARDHPHTQWTLSDIARCHAAQGKMEEAIAAQQEVMEKNKEVLGPDNPDTLWVTNSLGILYERTGSLTDARLLHSRALEGQTRVLGKDHAHTKWSRETLKRLDSAEKDQDAKLST